MLSIGPQQKRALHRRTAARTVAFYAVFSFLWIYFSDVLLTRVCSDPGQLTQAQAIGAWLYIAVTALLLYLYLSYCLKMLRNREEAIEAEKIKARQDTHERCKALEQTKDDLLTSISHEMRTPLTAIGGFAELLLNEPEVPEQQRRHLGIICQEAEKLTEIINRFQALRRLKSDRDKALHHQSTGKNKP